MPHEVTGILRDMVRQPSTYPPGDTSALCAWLASELRACGYEVRVLSRTPGLDNVVARLAAKSGDKSPVLAFNCHVDTVAPGEGWITDPYALTPAAGGMLAGLGAVNCKGTAATHLWLAREIARVGGPLAGSVVFSFVGDEERLGPDGTQYLAERGVLAPDMLVMAAPTANKLIVEERGVLWAELKTRGRAAHAGDPDAGDSAIARMLRMLAHLSRDMGRHLEGRKEASHRSTINVGTIAGGVNTNVVPERCSATIDRRLLPQSETVSGALEELRASLRGAGEPEALWSLELITGTDGFRMSPGQPLVAAFSAAVREATGEDACFVTPVGASDARFLAAGGAQIVIFGPGDDRQGHAANESMNEAQLVAACAIQRGVARRVLGLAS
jgi:acetylornithine deacetylase/succinyl-diaminopimelate desuccinylase-like protein